MYAMTLAVKPSFIECNSIIYALLFNRLVPIKENRQGSKNRTNKKKNVLMMLFSMTASSIMQYGK